MPQWSKISIPYLMVVPNYWSWFKLLTRLNKSDFSGQMFIKIEVITSLIEMLQLPNLVTWPHLWYIFSHLINYFWWRHNTEITTSQPLFQQSFILRKPRVAIFVDIMKAVGIKTIVKYWKKNLEIMYQNTIYISISWSSKIYWFLMNNADVSRT